jgi:histidinol-phosphatase (PHP family)
MYLADYHTHSRYSFDGSEELDTMCQHAIAAGLSEIAVTDHMDIYTGFGYGRMIDYDVTCGRPWVMQVRELYAELEQVRDRYAGRLKVKLGTELGQPQVNMAAARKFLADYPLDFVIGSVHNMEHDLDVYYYDFEKVDGEQLFDHYLDWLQEMADNCDFDVMGHITYPLRYLFERTGKRISLEPYEEKLRILFQTLVKSGRGIELNVSGLAKPMQETLPPFSLICLYRECGGEIITNGSDAHKAEQIGMFQKEGQQMLREAGFSYLTVYTGRKPEFVKL